MDMTQDLMAVPEHSHELDLSITIAFAVIGAVWAVVTFYVEYVKIDFVERLNC